MTLQYCSDLHLEFRENREFLKRHPLIPKGDILVLAGDIVPFAIMDDHKDFFNFVSDHFRYTYWVPGNHEYYHADAVQRSGVLNEKIRENVFLVNNVAVMHHDIKLIFSTLWSKISLANGRHIAMGMNDFQLIKYNGKKLSVDVYNELHQQSLDFIKQEAEMNNTKKVIITHHVPTFLNYPKRYKGDTLSEAFAVELFDLIDNSDIHSWVYGHHHNNTPDFKIENTLMLTNQLGYVQKGEHRHFVADKTLHLE